MITAIDHLVLTVADIRSAIAFYTKVLGMRAEQFQPSDGSAPRHALYFGKQKINLHAAASPYQPHAKTPLSGSADICFLSSLPLSHWQEHLSTCKVDIELGPVMRSGAVCPLHSIYIRDPDCNLIEVSYPERAV